ncbi:MAG: DUF1080 domain-containing protein [Planctomycetes bacterium]|nr:DUF1080 domain-containing protein [Planctomycetota bacterium]
MRKTTTCGKLGWIVVSVGVFASTAGFGGAPVGAAKPLSAITDLTQVDADFLFMGEYVGEVLLGTGERQRIGLQVVPLGGGRFFAVEYEGGLPGCGASGKARFRMEGQRRGDRLTFVAEPLEVVIYNGVATFTIQPRGLQIAQLTKIHRVSPTLGAPPPAGAIVLFDGTNTDQFRNGRMTEDRLLKVGTQLARVFRDYTLHLEFRLPYMPMARGQARANSGVYLQSRYEVQILDSFGLEGADNECGALYRQRAPDVNMCLPPLTWQTYDIDFRAPRFDSSGHKIQNARITVRHNGVIIHDNVEVVAKTGHGSPEGPTPLPIKLQDHGNPVVFRNIWIVDRSDSHCPSAPCVCGLAAAER